MTTTNLGLPLNVLGMALFKDSYVKAMGIIDAIHGKILTGSKTYDAASVAGAASTTTTVTVTGAALGDFVVGIALGLSAGGLTVTGYVSAADTVTVVLANNTASPVDLASTTLAVRVRKA